MAAAAGSAPKVLVPIADGSEEIETTTIINTLVRAGAAVTSASVSDSLQITGSRGIKLVADISIADAKDKEWDLVACPGGMPGATHLHESRALSDILVAQNQRGKHVAAICAAPAVVLAPLGILDDKKATCYPADGFTSKIKHIAPASEKVVIDGNVVTSRGPATALPFALSLVQVLFGEETRDKIAAQMLAQGL